MSLRIIFAGTPDFALPSMQALLQSEHEIIAVLTQPDRPAGRGRKLTASPVKVLGQQHALPVYQPLTLKETAIQNTLKKLQPDVMVVIAYGLLLPQAVLDIPRSGCINVHASLLPKWRGAAPIQRAILAGDSQTGVTIMQMEAGLDTGPMLQTVHCSIEPDETSQQLHDKLAELGAAALIATLMQVEKGALKPVAQNDKDATHAAKITKAQAAIDWQQSAVDIVNQVRAFNPWPVAFTHLHNQPLRVWQACALDQQSGLAPGSLVKADVDGVDVATGNGVVRLLKVQLAGKRVVAVRDFVNALQTELISEKTKFS